MKRKDVFRKLRTICQWLDEVDPIQEQYEHIRQSEELPAAREWMYENVVKPLYGEGEV